MFEVKDGARTLQFNGKLLGKSSSKRNDSTRWIEFELYKTDSGSYILSRIGVSLIFHGAACALVRRYGLTEIDFAELRENALPCEECEPSEEVELVFPEKYRYWAQVSSDPTSIVNALYKYDEAGVLYLTNVAQRLLDEVCKVDTAISDTYKYEIIP